jgi:hypothetical protein
MKTEDQDLKILASIRPNLEWCPECLVGKLWIEWANQYGLQYFCDNCKRTLRK